jgi:peptidoglycan LD-endopeptidase LytH
VAASGGCLAAALAAVVVVAGDIGVMTGPQKESIEHPTELDRARPPLPSSATPSIDPLTDLRDRGLQLPLRGVTREALRESFDETRGSTRVHEAIDILAPRNTPVVAVENGAIAHLFYSKAGGITVYQFDPAVRFVTTHTSSVTLTGSTRVIGSSARKSWATWARPAMRPKIPPTSISRSSD